MAKVVLIFAAGLLLISACSNKKSQEQEEITKPIETSVPPRMLTLKDSIMGKWELADNNDVQIQFGDIMMTFVGFVDIPYQVQANTIVMSNPDGSRESIEAKLLKDTLFLRNAEQDSFVRYVRHY